MTQKPWLTIAAVFAFGIGIGFLVGDGLRGHGRDREDVVFTQPREPQTEERSSSTESAGPAEPSPAESLSLGKTISAIPVPKADPGTGKITGRVASVNGDPLEGVTIRAERTRPSKGGDRPKEKDLETRVREFVTRARWEKATRRETVTGEDGSFVLTGLVEDVYSVKAFKEGYKIQPGDWLGSDRARPGDSVVFLARARVGVRIAILLPDGTEPSRAKVRIGRQRYWGATQPWSPEDPVLRRPPGTYRLSATAGDRGEYGSKAKIVTFVAGAPTRTVTLRLKKTVGIKGRVHLPEGFERDHVRVWALLLPPGQSPDTKKLIEKGESTQARSWDDYRFSFKDTPPGLYLVGASMERTRIGASATVEVTDGLAFVDLALSLPSNWRSIPLRVLDPDGEILWNVEVKSRFRSPRGWFSEGGNASKQADGSFLIAHPQRDEKEKKEGKGGKFTVEALSRRYGWKEVEYLLEETSEILVRFEEPALLEAVIAGFKDHEHKERLGLALEPEKEPGVRFRRSGFRYGSGEDIDDEGRKSFGPIQPGKYELILRVHTPEDAIPVNKSPVTLRGGKNRAVIEIPALHSLTVHFQKAKPGARVGLSTVKEERYSWSTQGKVTKDGKATFQYLPAGTYKVSIAGGMLPQEMKVSVPGSDVVRFEPSPLNALRVTVTDPEGELAKLGLRTGDLVIGMDGREFRSTQEFQAMVFMALGKKSVKLMVLRKNEKLEFEADARKLLKMEGGLGGSFYPTTR